MNALSAVLSFFGTFLGIFFLGIGVPILAIKVWTHYRLKKGRLALKNGKLASEPPFDPKPEPASGILLGRFNLPQRSYLRRQGRIGRSGYIAGSWVLFVLFCESLPPQMADSYDSALSVPQSVWYLNLRSGFGFDLFICCVAAALLACAAIQRKSSIELRSLRTRPLTLRFLFWARTGWALATLLASIATAAVGFLLLLLIFYGPVWNHVPSAISAPGITEQEAHDLISTLQTTPVRPILSWLTTSTLIFSLIVAVRSLPWGPVRKSNSTFATMRAALYWTIGFMVLLFFLAWTPPSLEFVRRILFLYNHHDGGPPPYACSLIPIVIAAALLRFGQFCYARKEIP